MNNTLFCRGNYRWRIWAAFALAILLHLTAIALAGMQTKQPVPPTTDAGGPEITVIPEGSEPSQSTEPPDPSPPPPTAEQALFPEDNSPPPMPSLNEKSSREFVRHTNFSGGRTLSAGAAKVMALNAPRLEYPYEARRQKITGSGVVVLIVDFASGIVSEVVMERSTGSAVLDSAATSGFRRWRFRPATVSRVRTPITFTMTGAMY